MHTVLTGPSPSLEEKLTWPNRHSIGLEEKRAVMELFDEAIASGESIGYSGAQEKAYTEAFAHYLGGGFADAVNSGSNALYVALRALNLDPFSEVIVSPVTDPGGVMAIPLNNLIPIPADVEPNTYNMGAEQIAARITPRTRAIVVAHISGLPANMTSICELARKHGLYVIEDCSQAHGAKHRGQMVGTFGDIGIFSMMNSKHHCMGGQGGMVFTKNENLSWRIRRASDRGKPFGLQHHTEGNVIATLNCSADEIGCAIGLTQLKKLPDILLRRRNAAAKITEGIRGLTSVRMMEPSQGDTGSYWFIFLRFEQAKSRVSKKEFVERLASGGIPFWHDYSCQPCRMAWYAERNVFGSSGYPWNAPEYRENALAEYETPNLSASIEEHFMLYFNEGVDTRHVKWVVETLEATEREFLK